MAVRGGIERILGRIRSCSFNKNGVRGIHGAGSTVRSSLYKKVVTGGAVLAASGLGIYAAKNILPILRDDVVTVPVVKAANVPESQPSVYSETKKHAVYIWIHLNSNANVQTCAKIAANLQRYVDHVVPPKDRDDEEEILAGVGFGPDFYRKVAGKTEKEFNYAHRKGALGDLPSTGGDIFIHAKSDTYSNLFELTQIILKQFPPGAVKQFEDVYSFVYKNGRDLSGFIDGTENPADEEHRQSVTVEKSTGASYVITQKWIHQFDVINSAGDKMEQWVGRSKPDSIELRRKSITSHLGRMTGGNNFEQKKRFEIVRQSMPYGSLSGEAGLFFIAYAESPENFDYMLDRMVGSGADGGHCDDVMRLTKCVTGSYWYFPSKNDLKKLQ